MRTARNILHAHRPSAPSSLHQISTAFIASITVNTRPAAARRSPSRSAQCQQPATRPLQAVRHSSGPTNCAATTNGTDGATSQPNNTYDVIVVGSGNGACAFLSHYLHAKKDATELRVAVVEEGAPFFETSFSTHQYNWTEAYSQQDLFKLHDAFTPGNVPIFTGRACTQGGGGSINYTMIHESSEWLAANIGQDPEYWNQLKCELNAKFNRPDPYPRLSQVAKMVIDAHKAVGYVDACHSIGYIPSFKEPAIDGTGGKDLYHVFNTQFDSHGMRTNSGVSLVDWEDSRLKLWTRTQVLNLEMADGSEAAASGQQGGTRCAAVIVQDVSGAPSSAPPPQRLELSPGGVVVMCAGAATPRLLARHGDTLGDKCIGQGAADHIVLPVGLFLVDRSKVWVTRKDLYLPVFTTFHVPVPGAEKQEIVANCDFFCGDLDVLIYLVSHLYLALLLPNFIKDDVIRNPRLFTAVKRLMTWLVLTSVGIYNFLSPHIDFTLVTGIVKYTQAKPGWYEDEGKRIVLPLFEKAGNGVSVDAEVAKEGLRRCLRITSKAGAPIPDWIAALVNFFTKLPFKESQVDRYVDYYTHKTLLMQQHMAGGCLFGQALDKGEHDPRSTGRLKGSSNVYVADLSAVPEPRVSPQMTAYIVGHHVARQLCAE